MASTDGRTSSRFVDRLARRRYDALSSSIDESSKADCQLPPDDLTIETQQESVERFFVLKPYVFAAHKVSLSSSCTFFTSSPSSSPC